MIGDVTVKKREPRRLCTSGGNRLSRRRRIAKRNKWIAAMIRQFVEKSVI